jgi:tRNA pseudouridine13 synthase
LNDGESLPFEAPPGYDAQPWPPVIDGARYRVRPEDFRVVEVLGFEPSGDGPHRLLRVEKRGCNTGWVAGQLARQLGVRGADVGYSGLKDRNAVTEQWFSVPASGPGRLDPDALAAAGIVVLADRPHGRKLRRGVHRANEFRLVLRDVRGDRTTIDDRLAAIAREGVPNAFGPQRFGRGGRNLELAQALAQGRRLRRRDRGFALSAARSLIFNALLARRVADGSWQRLLPGDRAGLAGSRSHFAVEEIDIELQTRLATHDVHPTGPLWGRGELPGAGAPAALEREVGRSLAPLDTLLEQAGLSQERRALRLSVEGLTWSWQAGALTLGFTLVAGGFATAVLGALAGIRPGAPSVPG